MRVLWLLLPMLSACSIRFAERPVTWAVSDRIDIPGPRERDYIPEQYFADALVMRSVPRSLGLPSRRRAQDINAMGGVPDSTWFTNRVGRHEVTPEQAALGPAGAGPPVAPFVVVKGKSGGGNPGFVVRDSNGGVFLVKFDTPENPEQQTAASVIVNRVLWTCGYNVPSDTIFGFRRGELTIGEGATYDDDLGRDQPFDDAELDLVLSHATLGSDGTFRASASQFLSGRPVGGFAQTGTRADDPNDGVRHQDRRSLRGLRAIAAWVSHTDMKEDNTLDMWVEDGTDHYLKHYLLDFGEALGAHQSEKGRREDGYEYIVDWSRNAASFASLGLPVREWERQELTAWSSVGWFGAEHFTPERWREAYPYRPFGVADRGDLYWGAKLVMSFDRELVEAIVAEGQYTDPAVSPYMVDALMARREKVGRAWLDGVSALDDFEIKAGELCMTDLVQHYGLNDPGLVESGRNSYVVSSDATVCVPIPDGEYTIMELRIRRSDGLRPAVRVHVGGAEPAVLGVVRTGR